MCVPKPEHTLRTLSTNRRGEGEAPPPAPSTYTPRRTRPAHARLTPGPYASDGAGGGGGKSGGREAAAAAVAAAGCGRGGGDRGGDGTAAHAPRPAEGGAASGPAPSHTRPAPAPAGPAPVGRSVNPSAQRVGGARGFRVPRRPTAPHVRDRVIAGSPSLATPTHVPGRRRRTRADGCEPLCRAGCPSCAPEGGRGAAPVSYPDRTTSPSGQRRHARGPRKRCLSGAGVLNGRGLADLNRTPTVPGVTWHGSGALDAAEGREGGREGRGCWEPGGWRWSVGITTFLCSGKQDSIKWTPPPPPGKYAFLTITRCLSLSTKQT